MQRVQTYRRTLRPLSMTWTRRMLGRQILLVFLLEWLTLWPNWTDLLQISHFAMI